MEERSALLAAFDMLDHNDSDTIGYAEFQAMVARVRPDADAKQTKQHNIRKWRCGICSTFAFVLVSISALTTLRQLATWCKRQTPQILIGEQIFVASQWAIKDILVACTHYYLYFVLARVTTKAQLPKYHLLHVCGCALPTGFFSALGFISIKSISPENKAVNEAL